MQRNEDARHWLTEWIRRRPKPDVTNVWNHLKRDQTLDQQSEHIEDESTHESYQH